MISYDFQRETETLNNFCPSQVCPNFHFFKRQICRYRTLSVQIFVLKKMKMWTHFRKSRRPEIVEGFQQRYNLVREYKYTTFMYIYRNILCILYWCIYKSIFRPAFVLIYQQLVFITNSIRYLILLMPGKTNLIAVSKGAPIFS